MGKEISNFGNSKFKRNLTTINVIIIILIASSFIIYSLIQEIVVLSMIDGHFVEIKKSEIKNSNRDFSYYIKDENDPIKEIFTAKITKSSIDQIKEDKLQIFTPMIQSEAFELYVNDMLIAIEGDVKNYNSNIWTKKFNYTVSAQIFDREINEIKIIQYSQYLGGSLGHPFIIAGYASSTVLRNFDTFDIPQVLLGIAIGMAIFLFLLMILLPSRRKVYYLILSFLVLMTIGYLEYFKFQQIGFSYLIFKKIIVSSTLLSVGVGTVLFRNLFVTKKHMLKIIIGCTLIIIVPTLFASNMIVYKKMYTILSMLVLPALVYLGYIAVRNYKMYEEGKMVFAMTATFIAYIVIWNIDEAFKLAYLPSSTEVMLPLFMVIGMTLIIIDVYELRLHDATTRIQYKDAYKKSIIDGLTGLYNLEYIKEKISELIGPYTVAMIDLDKFKDINDKHGHLIGDKALINFSNTALKLLREEDILGRYGGDEFLFILRITNKEEAEKILERIRFTVENEGKELNITISIGYFIAQGNESYEYIIAKADKALYMAKERGRNIICRAEDLTDK